jgi:hypothetical protein
VPFIVLGLLIHVDESILPVQIIKTLVHQYLGGGFSPRPPTPATGLLLSTLPPMMGWGWASRAPTSSPASMIATWLEGPAHLRNIYLFRFHDYDA